jgi:hypothetical protein
LATFNTFKNWEKSKIVTDEIGAPGMILIEYVSCCSKYLHIYGRADKENFWGFQIQIRQISSPYSLLLRHTLAEKFRYLVHDDILVIINQKGILYTTIPAELTPEPKELAWDKIPFSYGDGPISIVYPYVFSGWILSDLTSKKTTDLFPAFENALHIQFDVTPTEVIISGGSKKAVIANRNDLHQRRLVTLTTSSQEYFCIPSLKIWTCFNNEKMEVWSMETGALTFEAENTLPLYTGGNTVALGSRIFRSIQIDDSNIENAKNEPRYALAIYNWDSKNKILTLFKTIPLQSKGEGLRLLRMPNGFGAFIDIPSVCRFRIGPGINTMEAVEIRFPVSFEHFHFVNSIHDKWLSIRRLVKT